MQAVLLHLLQLEAHLLQASALVMSEEMAMDRMPLAASSPRTCSGHIHLNSRVRLKACIPTSPSTSWLCMWYGADICNSRARVHALQALPTSSALSPLMSTTATAAPASPNACANARPMPWPAPVSAHRPFCDADVVVARQQVRRLDRNLDAREGMRLKGAPKFCIACYIVRRRHL